MKKAFIIMLVFSLAVSIVSVNAEENYMTRLDAAVFISESLGIKYNKSTSPFTDVPEEYDSCFATLYTNGYVRGVSKTKFMPDREITEAEFLTMVLRMCNYKENSANYAWDSPYERANLLGLWEGGENDGKITRDEAVRIISNAFYVASLYSYNKPIETVTPSDDIKAEVIKAGELREGYINALSDFASTVGRIVFYAQTDEYTVIIGMVASPHGGSAKGCVISKENGDTLALKFTSDNPWKIKQPKDIRFSEDGDMLYYTCVAEQDFYAADMETLLVSAGEYIYTVNLKTMEIKSEYIQN